MFISIVLNTFPAIRTNYILFLHYIYGANCYINAPAFFCNVELIVLTVYRKKFMSTTCILNCIVLNFSTKTLIISRRLVIFVNYFVNISRVLNSLTRHDSSNVYVVINSIKHFSRVIPKVLCKSVSNVRKWRILKIFAISVTTHCFVNIAHSKIKVFCS